MFALNIIKLAKDILNNTVRRIIQNQLIKAGTSVRANYRAACRAKSNADFIYKINIVEEEADETLFWLEQILKLEYSKKKL